MTWPSSFGLHVTDGEGEPQRGRGLQRQAAGPQRRGAGPSTRLRPPRCPRVCRKGLCLRHIHAGLSWGTRLGAPPSTAQGSLCRPDTRGHLGTFWLGSKEPVGFCALPPSLAECPADIEEVAGQERPGSPIRDPSLPTSGSPEENTQFWTTGGAFLSTHAGGN